MSKAAKSCLAISLLFSQALSSAGCLAAADPGDPNSSKSSPLATVDRKSKIAQSANYSSSAVNTEEVPKQILRSGVNLTSRSMSANSRQLADEIHITPLLSRIQGLRKKVDPMDFAPTIENVAMSQQLTAAMVQAQGIIQEADLSIDYAIAEINAEQQIYQEVLNTYTSDRDKKVLQTNAMSFVANGALWAVCEGLDIPTYARPRYSVSSGTLGILAGIIPSIASAYALYQLNGKKSSSEHDPNMLSKLFDYPVTKDIDYPAPVWAFMNSVPAADQGGSSKSRKDQLIDRWRADKNIPQFTDKTSKSDFDVITASIPHKKGLTINSINTRLTLLQQLSSEIFKMKRLLLEISMVVRGEKDLDETS